MRVSLRRRPVRRRPRHAKRAQRRLLRVPSAPVKAWVRAPLHAAAHAAAGVPVVLVARWRRRRETLSLEHRRARAMVGAAIVIASVVLLTSFPISGLLSQRSALSSTAHELTTLHSENAALARQASELADPATVNGLARHDYGFVRQGQRAYDILPSSSASAPVSPGSGQVPLNGPPVVPGSALSQALVGVVASGGGKGGRHPNRARTRGLGNGGSPEPRGYWARVVRSLEFWN